MQRLMTRLTGLRPGDLAAALPFFALQAGIAAYWALAASAGDALLLSFLREHSLSVRAVVPWTYLAVAAGTAVAMTVFDALQKRFPRRLLVIAAPLALGASIAAARPLLALDAAWIRFALAVWLEVAAWVSLTLSFSLVADRFGSRDAKRLYGFIGGGFCAGLAAGGSAVPWLTTRVGAEGLVLVAAAVLWANAALSARVARAAAPRPSDGETPEPSPPLRALARDPYVVMVAAAVFLGGAIFVLVDFQLKSLASGLPQDQIAAFYGRLYGWAGAGEALVQFALLGPLIRRAGILNLQLVYPALMAAGAAATLRLPGLASAAGVNLARMISAESVERPTRELLFLPLAQRLRARAHALIDGAAASCGQGAAAVMLLVFAAAADQRTLAACALAASVLALVPLLLLRPRYRRLLSAAVRTRPLEPVDLARLAHEPGAREALAELLSSDDGSSVSFARAVLEEADGSRRPAASEPEDLPRVDEPSLSAAARCAVAAQLGRRGGELSARTLWALLPDADSALTAAAARGMLQIQRREAWRGPPSAQLARRRAAEAGALALLARARREAGGDPFRAAVIEDFARVRLDALLSLHALNGGPAALDDVRLDLWSRDPAARSAALELAEELLPARAVAALSAWADDAPDAAPRPRTRAALDALDPALGRLLDGGVHAARTARFKELPLFQGLETPYLLQLLEASEERRHAPGELLLREGDRGDALLLIEEGEIAVRSGGREVAALGAGECLGELSVIDGLPRSADAVCTTAARVVVIEQEAFRAVTSGRPAVGLLLARTLERRLRSALPPVPAPAAASPGSPALADARESGARRRLLTAASLRRAPLLAGLPEPALAAVAGLARPVPVFAGETLFAEGDPGDALYLIASGKISIESRGSVLAVLGPGDVFGELALLSGLGRTAAARVAADGLLFSIGAASFQRLLRDEPGVLWALLETLAGRLRATLKPAFAQPR